MKARSKVVAVIVATGFVLTLSPAAFALPSTNCYRLSQSIKADEDALRSCRAGGGGHFCQHIAQDVERMLQAYEDSCVYNRPLPGWVRNDPGWKPEPKLRKWHGGTN